ncbi:uncharacterized protein LOC135922862 [Gordionus sp. m RMFG-2023]|uniref:uncharacterized protein LOC135922862 n=1 Tax=Gordionus sp. m RMFG-2023 TaxID=3053472 RepID=UPI0031FC31B7
MASVFQGLEGIFYYMDDVLVTGATPDQHNIVWKRVLMHNDYHVVVTVCFNNDLEISMAVDASNKGVGGALLHVIEGLERPIIFFSRVFRDVETRYSVIEQEALAVIFGLTKCREYLIVVDSFSKWIEYAEVYGYTTKIVIKKLKELYVRFGFPDTIVSDRGPAFVSEEFSFVLCHRPSIFLRRRIIPARMDKLRGW